MLRLLPPRPFGPTLLLRSVLVWFLLRLTAGSAAAWQGEPVRATLQSSLLAILWIAGATTVAVWFEMWRRGELVFLANLGYSARKLCIAAAVTACSLEVALGLSVG